MPVCFQLYRIGSQTPEIFQKLDDEMREHFGAPPDPDHYLNGWYDSIGIRLAMGKSFHQIKEEFEKYREEFKVEASEKSDIYGNLLCILEYIKERFTPNSFYSPFK